MKELKNIGVVAVVFLSVIAVTLGQSIDKPLTVNPNHTFAWDDTNSPPCVRYTVYGKSQGTGAVTRAVSTTLRQITYDTLFGNNHPIGLNAVYVIGVDSAGQLSDISTNYYVNWTPKKKGKPIRLRTL